MYLKFFKDDYNQKNIFLLWNDIVIGVTSIASVERYVRELNKKINPLDQKPIIKTPKSSIVVSPPRSQHEEIVSMLKMLNYKMDDIKSHFVQSQTMISDDLPLQSEHEFEKFSNPIFRENVFGFFLRTIVGPNWKAIIFALLDRLFTEELQSRLLWPSKMLVLILSTQSH